MRIAAVAAAAVLLGCGGPSGGTVSLVLDIPNAVLDPKGFSNVEIRLHQDSGDTEINVAVANNEFDLGETEIKTGVLIEAVLRTDSGAAVGYGRAAAPADLTAGAEIVVPVRRPIVYFSGLVSTDLDGNPNTNDIHWTTAPATYSDLSTGTSLDGSTVLDQKAVVMVAAGPKLFMIDQPPSDPDGTLTGAPTIKNVSTGDHAIIGSLPAVMTGAVQDAAGSDDGRLLLVGTSMRLFVVDTEAGSAKPVADGNFERVAIVSAGGGAMTAVAIKRVSNTPASCPLRELVWIAVNADDTNQVMTLGSGGYADVAGDRGRAFYVESCKGELGEATASGVTMMRSGLGKPTALAVSGSQAWIGIEKPGSPAQMALISAALDGNDPPRTLFSEPSVQVVSAVDYPGVQRQLSSESALFNQLEIGAGGDYVAVTLASTYFGQAIPAASFPEMNIESQELRVLDAATGAVVQRYRSWCDGTLLIAPGDIRNWGCATSPGQSAPTNLNLEHRIGSMTFQYGKK